MQSQRIKIVNGQIITPYRIIINGTVMLEDGIITGVSDREIDTPADVEIDASGFYVAPGFIDLHVHGGGGHDFMDGNTEAFLKIAATHARFGTTSMLPTTLAS